MLYHYTSVETLYKILKNSEDGFIKLRANYYKNMNDTVECQYFINAISKLLPDQESINLDRTLHEVGFPYLISLSEYEDDLPMWNMYGDKGHGVAIGFSRDMLLDATSRFQDYGDDKTKALKKRCFCKFYKCKYWKEEQVDSEFIKKYNVNETVLKSTNEQTQKEICSISYLIKHPSFHYEGESRVVFMLKCPIYKRPDYIELYVRKEALKVIVCGPCVDEGYVKAVISGLFGGHVKRSEIPFASSL